MVKKLKKDFSFVYENIDGCPLEVLYWYHSAGKDDRKIFETAVYYRTCALKEKDKVYIEHLEAFQTNKVLTYPKIDDGFFTKGVRKILEYFEGPKREITKSNNEDVDFNLVATDNLFFRNLWSKYILDEVKENTVKLWNKLDHFEKISFRNKIEKYLRNFNKTPKLSEYEDMYFYKNGDFIKSSEIIKELKNKGK